MRDWHYPDRRNVLAATGSLGLGIAASSRSWAGARQKPDVDGKTSWSESIMAVYLSDDLRTGLSYRICRFPDLNDTWVWCHVIADGVMYAYTAQYLPCTAAHNVPDSDGAIYDVPGLRARMTRAGTSADLQRMSFFFESGCHAGGAPREGGGRVPVTLDGMFYPARAHHTLLAGRFERNGRIEAELRVAGKTYALAGVGKQHEQTQTAPRFLQSFTYGTMWNSRASFLGLLVGDKGGGDFETADGAKVLKSLSITKPGPDRRFEGAFTDGSKLEGTAHAVLTFGVPVYRRVWHGTMVSATVNGERMVGTLNDWRPENQSYASF